MLGEGVMEKRMKLGRDAGLAERTESFQRVSGREGQYGEEDFAY